MKRSDINLLDSHLADKNLTWVAQDLIAMDNADRVCQLLGADTRYIQEGRDLFRRFAREIDPAFARQARELAETWRNEGNAPAYIYTEAQNHGSSLRFPELPTEGTLDEIFDGYQHTINMHKVASKTRGTLGEIAPLFGDDIRPNN